MAHAVTNYQKGYYLIQCSSCSSQWRVRGSYVKLSKDKEIKAYKSTTTEECPACGKTEELVAKAPWWKLIQKAKTVYRPYQTEVHCKHGTISSIRFNSVKDVRARGAIIPYLIVAHSTEAVPVRGDFTTAKNFVVSLSEDCEAHESGYTIKPFDIVVTSSKLILYKLSTVLCNERNPLVFTNKNDDYGVLSSNVSFTACLSYMDPIINKP